MPASGKFLSRRPRTTAFENQNFGVRRTAASREFAIWRGYRMQAKSFARRQTGFARPKALRAARARGMIMAGSGARTIVLAMACVVFAAATAAAAADGYRCRRRARKPDRRRLLPQHRPRLIRPPAHPRQKVSSRSRSPPASSLPAAMRPRSTRSSARCSTGSAAICRACRRWSAVSFRSALTAAASMARSRCRSPARSASSTIRRARSTSSPTALRWWFTTARSTPRISIRCRRRRCAICLLTASTCCAIPT